MLHSLLNLFRGAGSTGELQETDRVPMALAVLLLEIAHADGEVGLQEWEHLTETLQSRFALSAEAVRDLVELAGEARQESVDLYAYTKEINWAFSQEEKQNIVEQMWRLVLADGVIDKHEEALLRQMSDLIGLPHARMIEAKLTAKGN